MKKKRKEHGNHAGITVSATNNGQHFEPSFRVINFQAQMNQDSKGGVHENGSKYGNPVYRMFQPPANPTDWPEADGVG